MKRAKDDVYSKPLITVSCTFYYLIGISTIYSLGTILNLSFFICYMRTIITSVSELF